MVEQPVTIRPERGGAKIAEDVRSFAAWAFAMLRLPVSSRDDGVREIPLPEPWRAEWAGRETLRFATTAPGGETGTPVEPLAVGTPLGDWLIGQLQHQGLVVHAVPRSQPVSVQELAPRLFAPFTVDRGSIRLGGCTLEERPLLRYTCGSPAASEVRHEFYDAEGQPLDDSVVAALHLDVLEPRGGPVPRLGREQAGQWLQTAEAARGPRRQRPASAETGPRDQELLLVTAIWCRFVEAKLLLEIGEQQAEVRCQGWAQMLADGRLTPPPFTCPETGLASYHVAATDDGRISARDSIGVCAQSGRRVLTTELLACELTGRRMLPAYLTPCPVTGRRIARSALTACAQCQQAVDPECVRDQLCAACQKMAAVPSDDPRMARVLGAYPRLARRARWHIAETESVYTLTSVRYLHRLLLVVDKQSLRVLRLAQGSRLTRRWSDVPDRRWTEYLGSR